MVYIPVTNSSADMIQEVVEEMNTAAEIIYTAHVILLLIPIEILTQSNTMKSVKK